jgi:hypothetical protein
MAIAQSERVYLKYLKEVTWGTTPASALTILRFTKESLQTQRDVAPSEDVINKRRWREILELGVSGGGDMEFELSYGNLDALLEGALMSTWSVDDPSSGVDTLKDGTTLTSFTLEKEYTDVSRFLSFTGARIGTFGVQFTPGSPIRATLGGILSKSGISAAATVGTGADVAAPTNDVMVVGAHVSGMNEGGSAISNVLDFSINFDNSARLQRSIHSLEPYNIGVGRVKVEGSIQAYFETAALYDKFQDHTASSVDITVTDDAGNIYTFDVQALRWGTGEIQHQGAEGDIIVSQGFMAYEDTSSSSMITITRGA